MNNSGMILPKMSEGTTRLHVFLTPEQKKDIEQLGDMFEDALQLRVPPAVLIRYAIHRLVRDFDGGLFYHLTNTADKDGAELGAWLLNERTALLNSMGRRVKLSEVLPGESTSHNLARKAVRKFEQEVTEDGHQTEQ